MDDGSYGISAGLRTNFYMIILDNTSQLELACENVNISFDDCHILSSPDNNALSYLLTDLLPSYHPSSPEEYELLVDSEANKNFRSAQRTDDLKIFADSCQYLIPSIVALRSIKDLQTEVKNDPNFFRQYLKRLSSSELPYAIEMKNELLSNLEIHFGKTKRINYLAYVFMGISFLLFGYITILQRKIKQLSLDKDNLPVNQTSLQETLSPQEEKVLRLISKEMSNKEIAQSLYIDCLLYTSDAADE